MTRSRAAIHSHLLALCVFLPSLQHILRPLRLMDAHKEEA